MKTHGHEGDSRPTGPVEPARFDLNVFNQDDYWVDQSGWTHHVGDMTADERVALADWLLENCRHFYLQVVTRTALLVSTSKVGRAHDDMRGTAIAELESDWLDVLCASAEDWLLSTPLVQRLNANPRS